MSPGHNKGPLKALSLLLVLPLLMWDTLALGINCRGSWNCKTKRSILSMMTSMMHELGDEDIWKTGSHIMCLPVKGFYTPKNAGYCLFMQGDVGQNQILRPNGDLVTGVKGGDIKIKINQLYEHGCRGCGSVPLSDDNDPDELGILTVNYVKQRRSCEGVCAPDIFANTRTNPYLQPAPQPATTQPTPSPQSSDNL